jgi:hypothetical protein
MKFAGLALALIPSLRYEASAMTYSNDNLDAMLCFRKAGAPNPNDLHVNLGSIANLMALPLGTTTNLSTTNLYTTSQLASAMGQGTFENVKFSVTAGAWDLGFVGYPYPVHTSWFTSARTDAATRTTPFGRANSSKLGLADTQIDSIGENAATFSGHNVSGILNTPTAVGIPPGNLQQSCEAYLGPAGNLKGQAPVVVENQAPASFDSAIVSDLYIDIPTGAADPFNANLTTGNASYLGHFSFSPDGSLTFTRENASVVVPPPAAPTLQVMREGNISIISFGSANTATYTLYFTNLSGLSAPLGTWPFVSTNVVGNGSTVSFTDVTTSSNRVYRVSAH